MDTREEWLCSGNVKGFGWQSKAQKVLICVLIGRALEITYP